MPLSRQSEWPGRPAPVSPWHGLVAHVPASLAHPACTDGRPPAPPARCSCRAFTLIELIFVLALLAISATLVVAGMGGFFRGRALHSEARRVLSLAHLGQSRAVSEGVPVVLWFNPVDGTYGLTVQSSFNDADGDERAITHVVDSSLKLELPVQDTSLLSEQDDEKLGLPENLQVIRFNPDGFIDETSLPKVTIRQGNEAALDVVLTPNRLAYEILPTSNLN